MRFYLKDYHTSGGAGPTEITGVTFQQVSRKIWGGGVLQCTVDNFERTALSTLRDYLWERVEVKKNDGSTVLWEGFINRITYNNNKVTFYGIDALRALDKVWAHHTAVLATGSVTSLETADSIDDTNASFTTALETKPCIFTDVAQPGQEEIYPNADTDFYHSGTADDPADIETGNWTDLNPGDYGEMKIVEYVDNYEADGYGIDIEFDSSDLATSTHIKIIVQLYMLAGSFYGVAGDRPEFWIYDDNGAAWVNGASGDYTGIGRIPEWGAKSSWVQHEITVVDNVADYVSAGNEIKIRVTCGDPNNTTPKYAYAWMVVKWAKLINTYEATFDAHEIVYTVDDASSSTRLIFTGQTPQADGIAAGDLYRVGDVLSTILENMWESAAINFVQLDVEASTLVDAGNFWYDYVGSVLRLFAERMNRQVWHEIGWTIKCYSTITDTALDLTEANCKPTYYGDIDGDNIVRCALVSGANNEAVNYNTPDYPSPYTTIRNEPQIMTEETAVAYASELTTLNASPVHNLHLTVDFDDGNNYSAADIGKGIDIDLFSSDISISQGIIKELSYSQNRGEHLMVEMVIDAS
jgi:hypothetical protein